MVKVFANPHNAEKGVVMKKQKETAAEFRRKLEASPEYRRSLEEDAQIVLTQDKQGPWKTLEDIEGERKKTS